MKKQLDPTLPHTYPRRILLAVAANSPQIVTETYYALARQTDPPWLPTEVHVITTLRGAEYVRAGLCTTHQNELSKLCTDYALPPPAFDASHIHLITDARDTALDDVRSGMDNTHAADFITRTVRHFTADPHTSLHVSLSGGRRTMTYYIGYALSLFGRAQDRLSHVLVEDEYYFNHEFYYPPPRPVWVVREDGSGFDAASVAVTLADIPFVRLREGLPTELLEGNRTFSATISTAQRRFDPLHVHLNWHRAQLHCGGIAISMPPVQLAFYAWMLQRHAQNQPPVHWTTQETPDLAVQFLDVYTRLHGQTGSYEQVAQALREGITKPWFEERKSHTHKVLKKILGQAAAEPYLIQAHGTKPRTRFGLGLPSDVVDFTHEP
ncbi:CRISPR-associated ring nuclease Csm6 [Thiothrix fructosivorans]|uniref:TIGR02584 family CRISPR-associated protein n=1 Tax=Thiothrix fructosivorans TaxID=111770 RepID=A0A8B0SLA8_9GAMM|nr:CRISPR-associated ring nuclease Csm6 [Thiothrix fructosivorans]MBO0613283.1 TIGR02584 family CRISPR-associated protein [Thiothrix fructosivorans]QTX11280.1 TIGR02584 family CRISPR-associated protein [Thiothrix fructosivorans]